MAYKYFPHTEADITEMLARIGVSSLDDLFSDVPECIRFRKEYNLPEAKSELEVRELFARLAGGNKMLTCFAGAGVYDHYTPSVIPSIVQRSEFLTSYTPYQAEISQGTLHYIFEYQSMMTELTGMAISNASMYDGASATAEAVLMAKAAAKKANRVLVSKTVDDRTLNVILTYAHFHGVDIDLIEATDGATDLADMNAKLEAGGVAGVVMQQPNKYGVVEDFTGVADACHSKKAMLVINSVAADLALLRTPGEWGADIAVGDVQSLGVPMSFGGPYAGYMCCTEKLMRKLPGRIVGCTRDTEGRRCFVLTLQAREQHIRREKATSNICSNQSLMALWVTIYMSLMGKQGVKEAAQLSYDGAHYMQEQLLATGRFAARFDRPFFNEFCVTFDGDVDALQKHLVDNGILGGVKIDANTIMFAVTEKRSKEEIDRVVELSKEI
ncbi:MAG: aminomethyl-transferring glycine dehydrogenase subunit GcvPA [Muribaculaceae bacterium]